MGTGRALRSLAWPQKFGAEASTVVAALRSAVTASPKSEIVMWRLTVKAERVKKLVRWQRVCVDAFRQKRSSEPGDAAMVTSERHNYFTFFRPPLFNLRRKPHLRHSHRTQLGGLS